MGPRCLLQHPPRAMSASESVSCKRRGPTPRFHYIPAATGQRSDGRVNATAGACGSWAIPHSRGPCIPECSPSSVLQGTPQAVLRRRGLVHFGLRRRGPVARDPSDERQRWSETHCLATLRRTSFLPQPPLVLLRARGHLVLTQDRPIINDGNLSCTSSRRRRPTLCLTRCTLSRSRRFTFDPEFLRLSPPSLIRRFLSMACE